MTPDVIIERAKAKAPVPAPAPYKAAIEFSQGRAIPASGLLLVVAAMVVAVTAFFAGLKELSAAAYAPKAVDERPPTEEELEAAQGMEALMANMLIDQMRKSVPDSEFMPKSSGEKIFESLLDYEYAQTMSRAGTFGLSELILAEMRRNR